VLTYPAHQVVGVTQQCAFAEHQRDICIEALNEDDVFALKCKAGLSFQQM
jgi:hypothetical protein